MDLTILGNFDLLYSNILLFLVLYNQVFTKLRLNSELCHPSKILLLYMRI